jgi:hypothetical protein
VLARAEHLAELAIDPLDVAVVRDHEDHTAVLRQRDLGELGQPQRPVLAGQRGPDRPRRAPVADRIDERRAGRVSRPAGCVRHQPPLTGTPVRRLRAGVPRRQPSRAMSLKVPAIRSATARNSLAVSSVSTGSVPTTRWTAASRPLWIEPVPTSSTYPSTNRPENRARTRMPAVTVMPSGTE